MSSQKIRIPKWVTDIGAHVYIISNNELIGMMKAHVDKDGAITYTMLNKPDDGRCTGCGTCCNITGTVIPRKLFDKMKTRLADYDYSDSGPCPFLDSDGCILGTVMPISCITSVCTGYVGCTEVLE